MMNKLSWPLYDKRLLAFFVLSVGKHQLYVKKTLI